MSDSVIDLDRHTEISCSRIGDPVTTEKWWQASQVSEEDQFVGQGGDISRRVSPRGIGVFMTRCHRTPYHMDVVVVVAYD